MNKKAHNTYTEDGVWKKARKESLNYKHILTFELSRHVDGSASAMADMVLKYAVLLSNPGAIQDKEIDWTPGIKYAKMHNLPISKYVSSLI
jgi:hypothetical protein